MSVIPETRTIGDRRRINIPHEIVCEFGGFERFRAKTAEESVILTPTNDRDALVLTGKNRIRLPKHITEQYEDGEEFAVFIDGGRIALKPTAEIEISL